MSLRIGNPTMPFASKRGHVRQKNAGQQLPSVLGIFSAFHIWRISATSPIKPEKHTRNIALDTIPSIITVADVASIFSEHTSAMNARPMPIAPCNSKSTYACQIPLSPLHAFRQPWDHSISEEFLQLVSMLHPHLVSLKPDSEFLSLQGNMCSSEVQLRLPYIDNVIFLHKEVNAW